MNDEKLRKLAHRIIDIVEETILIENPHLEDHLDKRGNTFLYGDAYYELEDVIVDLLKGDE